MQAEKIELIKLLADVDSESVIKKIQSILKPGKTISALSNQAMDKRLEESMQQIRDGKGIKISLDDDIWK